MMVESRAGEDEFSQTDVNNALVSYSTEVEITNTNLRIVQALLDRILTP